MTTASNILELQLGLASAALELGEPCEVYRPIAPLTAALDSSAMLGQVLAAFPIDYAYKAPIDPLKPRRVAITDMSIVQTNDYVKSLSDGKTYFIGAVDVLMPVYAVICNCILSIYNQSNIGGTAGNVGRLGNTVDTSAETGQLKLNNWPASALYSGRGAKTLSGLPTDDTAPQFTVLLPTLTIPVIVGDIVILSDQRKLVVRAAEDNAGGTRLICIQAVQ